MFECSGWLVLDVAANYDGAEAERHSAIAAALQRLLPTIEPVFPTVLTRWMNGECYMFLGLSRNHESGCLRDIILLLERTCAELPGTYGALHHRDNEALIRPEAFRTIYVGSGKLTEAIDEALTAIA